MSGFVELHSKDFWSMANYYETRWEQGLESSSQGTFVHHNKCLVLWTRIFFIPTFPNNLSVPWYVRGGVVSMTAYPVKPLTAEKSEATCLEDSTDLRTWRTWVLNPNIQGGERVSTTLPTRRQHAAYLLSYQFRPRRGLEPGQIHGTP